MALNKIPRCQLDGLVDPALGFSSNWEVRCMVSLVAELAFRCLQPDREMRPSIKEVLETLRVIEKVGRVALQHRILADEICDLRGAVAFTSSLLKRKLAPNSSSLSSLFSRLSRRCHAALDTETKKRSSSCILGPDLPDIWTPLSSTVPPRTLPGGGVNHDARPTIIDGKSISEEIRSEISKTVRDLKSSYGKVPGLTVILVEQRRDSQSYVRFNEDPSVHGILLQLPLPQHMDEERILGAISLEKDVDGFHPLNVGNLALWARQPLFIPCAAKACVGLLLRYRIDLMGKHAVVIGRSKVVGLPTSLLLQEKM
ncbi:bifunctional protein FolD 1 [Carex littledalei]|uniref:Bifunctional protein FolD 1 n=1 Tax=Carex littledalei TaxID=544730 RepID=A0A833W3J2_9POAL|nr:bifunctional protein FolD 1 [Carex littledalei]